MTYLYLDIETIPAQDPLAQQYLAQSVKINSRLTDPAKIEAARAKAEAEAVSETSFDGWFGQICCMAWAVDGGEIVTVSDSERSEFEMITHLFAQFDDRSRPIIVGHNVAGFDIPFITRRAVSLGVELPVGYLWPRDPKPWDKSVHDTMVMAAGARDRISLDRLCHALGVPGKDGFDGSMVAEAWANGEHRKIAEYCADDVRRVRDIHNRFMAAGW